MSRGTELFRLDGYCCLVTGASKGLGRAMAGALASAGAGVVVTSRRQDQAQAAADEIRAGRRRALAVEADVADRHAVTALVRRAEQAFGKIDVLVNHAGVGTIRPALDLGDDDWDTVAAVNLKGSFLCAQAVAPGMTERGYGRVINIGSILSHIGAAGLAGYIASKHGLLGLTRALALEWAPYGITVNCLCPGFFETELTRSLVEDPAAHASVVARTPVARWGRPEDLDSAILFLASPASGFVTGTAVQVDGGWCAQ